MKPQITNPPRPSTRKYRDTRSIKMQIEGPHQQKTSIMDLLQNLNEFKTQLQNYVVDRTPQTKSPPTTSIPQSPYKSPKPQVTEFKLQGYRMDYDRYKFKGELTPILQQPDQFSDQKIPESTTNSSYLIFKQSYSQRTPSPNRQNSAFMKRRTMNVTTPEEFRTFSTIRSQKSTENVVQEIGDIVTEQCFCEIGRFQEVAVSVRESLTMKEEIKGRESIEIRKKYQVAKENTIPNIQLSKHRRKLSTVLSMQNRDKSNAYKRKSLSFMIPSESEKLRMAQLANYATKLGLIVLSE